MIFLEFIKAAILEKAQLKWNIIIKYWEIIVWYKKIELDKLVINNLKLNPDVLGAPISIWLRKLGLVRLSLSSVRVLSQNQSRLHPCLHLPKSCLLLSQTVKGRWSYLKCLQKVLERLTRTLVSTKPTLELVLATSWLLTLTPASRHRCAESLVSPEVGPLLPRHHKLLAKKVRPKSVTDLLQVQKGVILWSELILVWCGQCTES